MKYQVREIETPVNFNLGSRKNFFDDKPLGTEKNNVDASSLKNYSFYTKMQTLEEVEKSFFKNILIF